MRPMGDLSGNLRVLLRRNAGFACFLAWNYIALYGCAMAIGSFVPYNLEYIWLVSGAAGAASSLVGLALAAKHPRALASRHWGLAAVGCAIAGNVSLWASYALIETFWVMFAVAGVLDGVALTIMTAVWGARLTACNEARIEFDVVACFLIAFLLYCVTLPIKLWGLVDLVVACALPALSMWLAYRRDEGDPDRAHAPRGPQPAGVWGEAASLRSEAITIAALWLLVAFFRVVDAPVDAYDRYGRYFISFAVAALVVAALMPLLLRGARLVNLFMAFRWLLPFVLANLAALCLCGQGFAGHVTSYTLIHTGMFGMEASVWIGLAKHLRRTGSRPLVAFLLLALARGAGIVLGAGVGLLVARGAEEPLQLVGCALAVTTLAALVVMACGFNPDWYFVRLRRGERAAGPCASEAQRVGETIGPTARGKASHAQAGDSPDAGARAGRAVVEAGAAQGSAGETSARLDRATQMFEAVMHERADALRAQRGLTERETEVAFLLLCGKSRPYIRDELGISLNTVHAHARSVLSKCGVHSQQELAELAGRA